MLGQEFVVMHDLLNGNVLSVGWRGEGAHDVFWKRYGILAMVNFQFHLIARVDDSTQLVLGHIRVHDAFPNALKTREGVIDRRGFIAAVHHAIGALRVAAFVTVIGPISFIDQFLKCVGVAFLQ